MRVHHLNCGTMCPFAVSGQHFVCHVLLLETDAGLVLIDSGYGTGDIAHPKRIGPVRRFLRPTFDPIETAIAQLRKLGHDPADVRHIVLTHLDIDHCGALGDFPDAQVHVLADEYAAATKPPTLADRSRYFPAQWAHGPSWVLHRPDGDSWEGLRCRPPDPGPRRPGRDGAAAGPHPRTRRHRGRCRRPLAAPRRRRVLPSRRTPAGRIGSE